VAKIFNEKKADIIAGKLKDTARNILANGEFVVHLADEAIAVRCSGLVSRAWFSRCLRRRSMPSGCAVFARSNSGRTGGCIEIDSG